MTSIKPLATISLLALILGTAACSSTPQRPDRQPLTRQTPAGPTAQELFLQGNAFLNERQWSAAVDQYRQALRQAPDRWDIHMNLAIALSASNEFADAVHAMEKALEYGGDQHPEIYFNLGNIYQNRGLYSQSIRAYRAGMAVRGKLDVASLLNIGAAYTFLSEFDAARQTLAKAVELAPDDPRPRHSLALLLQSEDRLEEALQAYEAIHQMDPNYAPSHFNRGFVLQRMNRHKESIPAFERYIELEPDGPYVKRAQNYIDRARQNL